MEKHTSTDDKSCTCKLCERNKRIFYMLTRMRKADLNGDVEFIESLIDELDSANFELDWITSGMDNHFVSIKELSERFHLPWCEVSKYLKERRNTPVA